MSHYIDFKEAIIDHCFKEMKENIIFFDQQSKDITFLLKISTLKPVIIFQNDSNNIFETHKGFWKVYVINDTLLNQKIYLTNSITLFISSNKVLVSALRNLRQSIWWNHEALFLIVNKSASNSCATSARETLKTVWSFNILSAIYLCQNSKEELSMYTFNPYTYIAPKIWKRMKIDNEKKFYWTIFEYLIEHQKFFHMFNSSFCDILFFDKAKNLNGYNIKTGVYQFSSKFQLDLSMPGSDNCSGPSPNIMYQVLQRMNATISIKKQGLYGHIDDRGAPVGLVKDVLTGGVDLTLSMYGLKEFVRLQTHYVYHDSLIIVSSKSLVSETDKVIEVFTEKITLFLIASICIIIFTLKFILKQSILKTLLEFIRIFVGVSSFSQPSNAFKNMLFLAVVFTNFIINTYIQTRLSAVNTTPKLKHIDTVEDFLKSNKPLYILKSFEKVIIDLRVRKHFQFIKSFEECIWRLNNREYITCAYADSLVRYHLYESEYVHISKGTLYETNLMYVCAEDSPIRYKINNILLRFSEAGIANLMYDRAKRYFLKNTEIDLQRNLTIENFSSSFLFLCWGCILAIIVLFFEIIYNFCFPKKKNLNHRKKFCKTQCSNQREFSLRHLA